MKILIIVALLVVFWYFRRKGIKTALKGRALRRKLRRKAFEHAVSVSKDQEE